MQQAFLIFRNNSCLLYYRAYAATKQTTVVGPSLEVSLSDGLFLSKGVRSQSTERKALYNDGLGYYKASCASAVCLQFIACKCGPGRASRTDLRSVKRSPKRQANAQRNILSETSYGLTKDAEYKSSVKYSETSLQEKNYLQRSVSADNVVIRSRGYKPSDRHDPVKRNFLENLTSKILHFGMEPSETTPINLQKLLTPASDTHELLQSKSSKKMFASSYFYAPTHPTVEDQVELARRISHSLSDVKNVKSKGQSMYVNRKKRSVKWIHDGNGVEDEEELITTVHKDKLPLKCVMNPCGKVLDIKGIQALGEEVNIAPVPKNPEKLFDIVRDLNNQRGRGAEIFAKRRKRSEKWVVDQEQPQTPNTPTTPKPPTYPEKLEINGNTKFATPSLLTPHTPISSTDKSFYNPFTVDISVESANTPITGNKLYENNNYTGPKLASLHNLTNYNTAPRGWDQALTFYRPIKFEKPQEIMYSDF